MSEQWERGEHPGQAEVHEPVEPEDRPDHEIEGAPRVTISETRLWVVSSSKSTKLVVADSPAEAEALWREHTSSGTPLRVLPLLMERVLARVVAW